jgi:hypothetical protein
MTTFDPQPQSRRAVRQSERAEAQSGEQQASYHGFTDPNGVFGDGVDMWDTTARRAAQLPASGRPAEPPVTGRRAAAPPQPAAEPLTYATQNRAPGTAYEPPVQRSEPDLPPTQALPRQDAPQYRVRDYSPEGRRAAVAPQAPATVPAETWSLGAPEPSAPAVPPVEAPAAAVPEPQQAPIPVERTMTRRELRALQQAQLGAVADAESAAPFAEAQQSGEPQVAPPALIEPRPQPVVPGYDAPSDATTAFLQSVTAQPESQPQPAATDEPVRSPFDALFSPPPAGSTTPPAPSGFDLLSSAPSEPAAPPARAAQPEPGVWTPPTGHWSQQLDADEDPFENTLSRSIRSGQTATNALVLPNMPQYDDIRGPLTSTGEVMLTGSIDLPIGLGATGTHDRIEHDGIDALFDVNDAEISSTDSSPVSAIRAVSTHTSGHSVTHTQKPKGNKVLTGLIVAAGGMAVVVLGMLVFAFNVL